MSGRCLTVALNGADTSVSSPAASVSDKFSFVADVRLHVMGPKYRHTSIRLDFCNENCEILESTSSTKLQNADGWIKVHIGRVNSSNPEIQLAIIALQVDR
ncbi:MAG: hypothetical protein MK171_03495 [Pirellulales bacterium]|nr:hypothetical protein [Pirellulales bacterium]